MKISQPGYNVKTADPQNLVFSSAFATMNIALQGTAARTQNGGSYTFTIAHGLAFTPFALVYYNTSVYSTAWVFAPTAGLINNSNGDQTQIDSSDIRMDATNLNVIASFNNGVSETITIRYYIFNVSI